MPRLFARLFSHLRLSQTLLYSIHYDSTHGVLPNASELTVDETANCLVWRGRRITLFSERDPLKLDWASVGAEYIAECTGKLLTTPLASQHIQAGAKKVVMSAPAKCVALCPLRAWPPFLPCRARLACDLC